VVAARIDRTFLDADGVRWIVDFKTSLHEGDDLETFLDREQQRYAPQLESYAALLAAYQPSARVRLGLYFALHARWREWAAPGGSP
jgi:ATP-dependent helicase/nuclease subunit A